MNADCPAGYLVSVNVGRPRTVEWNGRAVSTAIWKSPVPGRVAVRGVNADGDQQADLDNHGGSDKALYAYSLADYEWWAWELGSVLGPGTFGDNLTIGGLDVSDARIGERWLVGDVELEVAGPRIPCYKLGLRMADRSFPRRFAAACRPGAYLRIRREGILGAGDRIRLAERPSHTLTCAAVSRAYHGEHALVPLLLEVPALASNWRDWARSRLGRPPGDLPR